MASGVLQFQSMSRLTNCLRITACTATFLLAASDKSVPTGDQILDRLAVADEARDDALEAYTVSRSYQLASEKKGRKVTATAEFKYLKSGKSYKIVEEGGSEGLFRSALHKIMQAEVKASTKEEEADVSPRNYSARLAGTETIGGHFCYILELTPKRKSKYLLNGKAWVDSTEFALVKIEGRPSESISFWVGKPYIEQTFERVGDYWLLSRNKSIADARFFGPIELVIQSNGYRVTPEKMLVSQKRHATTAP